MFVDFRAFIVESETNATDIVANSAMRIIARTYATPRRQREGNRPPDRRHRGLAIDKQSLCVVFMSYSHSFGVRQRQDRYAKRHVEARGNRRAV